MWKEMGSEVMHVKILQISYSDGLPCSEPEGSLVWLTEGSQWAFFRICGLMPM